MRSLHATTKKHGYLFKNVHRFVAVFRLQEIGQKKNTGNRSYTTSIITFTSGLVIAARSHLLRWKLVFRSDIRSDFLKSCFGLVAINHICVSIQSKSIKKTLLQPKISQTWKKEDLSTRCCACWWCCIILHCSILRLITMIKSTKKDCRSF